MHTNRISMDGRKRIIMETIIENISGACVCRWCIELNLHHKRAILSFSNVLRINASKRQCGRESIDALSMTIKTHTFENAKVWTAWPQSLLRAQKSYKKSNSCISALKRKNKQTIPFKLLEARHNSQIIALQKILFQVGLLYKNALEQFHSHVTVLVENAFCQANILLYPAVSSSILYCSPAN